MNLMNLSFLTVEAKCFRLSEMMKENMVLIPHFFQAWGVPEKGAIVATAVLTGAAWLSTTSVSWEAAKFSEQSPLGFRIFLFTSL